MNSYMIDDSYFENKYVVFLMRTLSKIVWFIKYRSVDNPINNELARELIDSVSKISHLNNTTDFDSLNQWNDIANNIRDNMIKHGVINFLQWECIRETMGEENSLFLYDEFKYVKKSPLWKTYRHKITYPNVGNPLPFLGDIELTGATVHHLYCLFKFIENTHIDISTLDNIYEFGGGYGNMCRLLYLFGFKGKYHIFDFQVMSAVQKYYLSNHGIENVNLVYKEEYWESLLKNTPKDERNLLIATWSLSESPLSVRKKTRMNMKLFDNFLIGYQKKFGEVDNEAYFNDIKSELDNINWLEFEMTKLPKHYLLVGSKK
ncbi:hypothetical protein CW613_001039 [Vibrio mimicus]